MSKYTYLDRNGVPCYRDGFGEEHRMKVGIETGHVYTDTDSCNFTLDKLKTAKKQELNSMYGKQVDDRSTVDWLNKHDNVCEMLKEVKKFSVMGIKPTISRVTENENNSLVGYIIMASEDDMRYMEYLLTAAREFIKKGDCNIDISVENMGDV